jgi:hypothetical protein
MESAILKALPKGEFFKLNDSESSPVWVRDYYDRGSRSIRVYKFDDINHEKFMRANKPVFVGFTF